MNADERSELSKALFSQRLDVFLAQYSVTDKEYLKYVLPHIPERLLFDADVAQREIRRFAHETRRLRS